MMELNSADVVEVAMQSKKTATVLWSNVCHGNQIETFINARGRIDLPQTLIL